MAVVQRTRLEPTRIGYQKTFRIRIRNPDPEKGDWLNLDEIASILCKAKKPGGDKITPTAAKVTPQAFGDHGVLTVLFTAAMLDEEDDYEFDIVMGASSSEEPLIERFVFTNQPVETE